MFGASTGFGRRVRTIAFDLENMHVPDDQLQADRQGRRPRGPTLRRTVVPRRRTRLVAVAIIVATITAACGSTSPSAAPGHDTHRSGRPDGAGGAWPPHWFAADPSEPTTTSLPSLTHGPLTSPPLPAPAPGFVAGHVTAVGDSVMLDYQTALEQDVPGIDVQAAVSRQWFTGETTIQQELAAGTLGAVVVVGLGTNGPITATDFNSMMTLLAGASRVIFVNVFVDRPWQGSNNSVLANGVAQHRNAALADWYTLASQHPTWLYSTQTHLPIGGPGAQALAALVASET